jgi:hypothetical protein
MKVKRITLVIVAAFFVLTMGVSMHSVFAGRIKQDIGSIDLNDLLAKAANYANRLEGAVFDFVCLEEIKEMINPSLEELKLVTITNWTRSKPIRRRVVKPVRRSLIYDYQCIRKGGKIYERRILLKENKEKKYEPDAPLKTSIFRYGTNMMGPVGLFGARFQPSYIYTIVGEKKIKGKKPLLSKLSPGSKTPLLLICTEKPGLLLIPVISLRSNGTNSVSAITRYLKSVEKNSKGNRELK